MINERNKIPTNSSSIQTQNSSSLPFSKTNIEVVAKDLEVPWALDFLPNGDLIFTERKGLIKLLKKDIKEIKILGEIKVKQIGESGLHGIAIDPNFSENHYLYLYYTYSGKDTDTLNRVSRFTYEDNNLENELIIVDKIPGAIYHDGGRIKFGPDGYLYITTGDATKPSLSQSKDSLAGKILRVTPEGNPAPNNPFNTAIYSYGHRNPQGIAWDSSGNLWATEHGRSGAKSGLDELNFIQAGNNYGWDIIEGIEQKTNMITPVINSGTDTTWAPAGIAFYKNSLFFAGLRGSTLYQAVLENNKVKELKKHFINQFGRIREVVLGPDNMLYITTSNKDGRGVPKSGDDKIIKVNPGSL